MSNPYRFAIAQPSPQCKRTVLLLPFVIGVFFAEGWLAGWRRADSSGQRSSACGEHGCYRQPKVRAPAESAKPAAPASAASIVAASNASPTVSNAAATKTTTATETSALAAPVTALVAAGKIPPAPALSAANQNRTAPNTAERRRDPFRPLVRSKDAGAVPFIGPPGKAGLSVNTLQVQGTMRDSDGMTAIVANPQGRVYFLHPGDQIYDAVVQSIGSGGVVFRQHTQDSFGHPVERIVTRLVGPASGGTP